MNKDSRPEHVQVPGEVKRPPMPRGLHPIARNAWRALEQSGQAQYFEPTDWAASRLLVEQLSRELAKDKPITASAFRVIWDAMQSLLMTESSRRRVRMEVDRVKPVEEAPPGIALIAEFKRQNG